MRRHCGGVYAWVLVALLACSLSILFAGPPDDLPSSPEELVQEYVRAFSDEDWKRFAELIDPAVLSGFQLRFIAAHETCNAEEEFKSESGLDLSELKAMSGRELLAVMLASVPADELLPVASSRVEIVGVVAEDDLRHIVYRFKSHEEGIEFTKVHLLTATQVGGGWAAKLFDDIEGALATLQLNLERC